MKIALIADTHFGARGDNQNLMDSMVRFYDNVFFPEIKSQGVEHIIHLGDLVDRRKYINIATLRTMQKKFIERIDVPMDVICGNHDAYYKNTNDVNSLDELIGADHPYIKVYKEPTERTIDGTQYLYLPWITSENEAQTLQAIDESDAPYAMGHLELNGFQMLRGLPCTHGLNPALLKKFVHVFTGHFHLKSVQDNIMYVGSPYEMNWAEAGDPHGFHIFNTENRELEHIENPYTNFVKIFYDADTAKNDIPDVSGKWTKIIVLDKPDNYEFDDYCNRVQDLHPLEMRVVEAISQDTQDIIVDEADDTQDIIEKAIDMRLDLDNDKKEALRALMRDLYRDASSVIMEK